MEFYSKCKETLRQGSFHLRKFKSNSRELENLVRDIFPDDIDNVTMVEKVLGILWGRESDDFLFNFDDALEKVCLQPTKRDILKFIASIYDPLGIINPVVVQMKILFQDICFSKLKWDEPLFIHFLDRWLIIINELKEVNNISINRNYCFNDMNDPFIKIEVHGFCDASKSANGCCVYIRFVKGSGEIVTKILTARSRVNSMRNYTIPMLELCGAVLLFNVLSQVVDELCTVYKITNIYA